MKILVVDDEETIVETVERRLQRAGYTVFTAGTAEDAMRLNRLTKTDLLLLDIMLPQRSGIELARRVREESNVPIIFLTAKAAEEDRVQGLELADDYVVKPFSLAELAARVKSVLRRSRPEESTEAIEIDNLRIDPKAHRVLLDGKELVLTPKEFGLLHFLASHAGQVFSRSALIDRVWGHDAYVTERTVDVHIRWLREKIEQDSAKPKRLVTVRGFGYKFEA